MCAPTWTAGKNRTRTVLKRGPSPYPIATNATSHTSEMPTTKAGPGQSVLSQHVGPVHEAAHAVVTHAKRPCGGCQGPPAQCGRLTKHTTLRTSALAAPTAARSAAEPVVVALAEAGAVRVLRLDHAGTGGAVFDRAPIPGVASQRVCHGAPGTPVCSRNTTQPGTSPCSTLVAWNTCPARAAMAYSRAGVGARTITLAVQRAHVRDVGRVLRASTHDATRAQLALGSPVPVDAELTLPCQVKCRAVLAVLARELLACVKQCRDSAFRERTASRFCDLPHQCATTHHHTHPEARARPSAIHAIGADTMVVTRVE